jgi:hypothetical protein
MSERTRPRRLQESPLPISKSEAIPVVSALPPTPAFNLAPEIKPANTNLRWLDSIPQLLSGPDTPDSNILFDAEYGIACVFYDTATMSEEAATAALLCASDISSDGAFILPSSITAPVKQSYKLDGKHTIGCTEDDPERASTWWVFTDFETIAISENAATALLDYLFRNYPDSGTIVTI